MSLPIGKDTKQSAHDLMQALQRDRQRLEVQINLGKKEFQDEWKTIEKKWLQFEHATKHLSEESVEALQKLGGELRDMYESIGDRLSRH